MIWNEAIYAGHAEGWIVPVGCPNPQGGMKFVDIVGRPEHQAVFARLLYYAPSIRRPSTCSSRSSRS